MDIFSNPPTEELSKKFLTLLYKQIFNTDEEESRAERLLLHYFSAIHCTNLWSFHLCTKTARPYKFGSNNRCCGCLFVSINPILYANLCFSGQ